ncbi:MAG: RtcB family protein [Candidatus Woesearchaeota archaeon]|jgi:hypothetical protein|nr:RtcB family protein [Candidatus Woesearchaeota archaeon]MDP7323194.1 RtcB family protein [Candidatus Woesearchaeota archaeon]MDP7457725.1 RtcB family protein [Candidatus Woesearchaeota archaeon]
MAKLINIGAETHYDPPDFAGLKEVVRFPDGEFKKPSTRDIPNSTVWVFDSGWGYVPEILGDDVGCGMAAFAIDPVDVRDATDIMYEHLKGQSILGRGNHFVDLCGPIMNGGRIVGSEEDHNILFLHTDGKQGDTTVPVDFRQAQTRQRQAEEFRTELGGKLAHRLGVNYSPLGNWTHNSVETNGKTIYRKGAVKVQPKKTHFLPAHLGAHIWAYTVDPDQMPPHDSLPHGTGRVGRRGDHKVSVEEVETLRDMVYIPKGISNASLRTEHPTCFNGFDKIVEHLGRGRYIKSIGETKIQGYLGKI